MLEHAFSFGGSAQLVGVLTDAANPAKDSKPAVLVLNSGLIHRIGPFRLHVDLARRLAEQGFSVFRFDLSGIGDSEKHKDSRQREEQILADISEAMDCLSTRKGAQKYIVIGLCTGADNAYKIAVRDERIIGAVFLDGYCYPTLGFQFRNYRKKYFSSKVWARRLARIFGNKSKKEVIAYQMHDQREENYFWKLPPKQKTENELQGMIARGVKLFYIFSGGFDMINYKEQLVECHKSIDFKNQLAVQYFNESEHIYPVISDRKKLIDSIKGWVCDNY